MPLKAPYPYLYYNPSDLRDKKVIVIANLKPTKLMGLISEGMLLAARKGKNLRILTIDGDIDDGAKVS